MNLQTRIKEGSFFELKIESGNTIIIEDLSTLKNSQWIIPEDKIEQLITIAHDCSRFNRTSDVDFVMKIFETFLNNAERAEFLGSVEKHSM